MIIMRTFIFLLFLLLLCSCSHKVIVNGTIDSGGDGALVIVNDTMRKLVEEDEQNKRSLTSYHKVYENKNFVLPTLTGTFSIKVKPSDSLMFTSQYYKPQYHAVNDLLKHKYIHIKLEENVCDTVTCKEKPVLYAIIANKISLKSRQKKGCKGRITLFFDSRFEAVYNVKESLYGGYNKDTIHFIVYDHYGRPNFEQYENVLLFITNGCGRNHHLKYQYAPVYKTIEGKWASPYISEIYRRLKDDSVKPEIVHFEKPVEYIIGDNANAKWVKQMYPEPYYRIEGNKAIAVYGNYIPEILQLKQETVLKNLGF